MLTNYDIKLSLSLTFLHSLQGEAETSGDVTSGAQAADSKPVNPLESKLVNPYETLDQFVRSACMCAQEETADKKGTIKTGSCQLLSNGHIPNKRMLLNKVLILCAEV